MCKNYKTENRTTSIHVGLDVTQSVMGMALAQFMKYRLNYKILVAPSVDMAWLAQASEIIVVGSKDDRQLT